MARRVALRRLRPSTTPPSRARHGAASPSARGAARRRAACAQLPARAATWLSYVDERREATGSLGARWRPARGLFRAFNTWRGARRAAGCCARRGHHAPLGVSRGAVVARLLRRGAPALHGLRRRPPATWAVKAQRLEARCARSSPPPRAKQVLAALERAAAERRRPRGRRPRRKRRPRRSAPGGRMASRPTASSSRHAAHRDGDQHEPRVAPSRARHARHHSSAATPRARRPPFVRGVGARDDGAAGARVHPRYRPGFVHVANRPPSRALARLRPRRRPPACLWPAERALGRGDGAAAHREREAHRARDHPPPTGRSRRYARRRPARRRARRATPPTRRPPRTRGASAAAAAGAAVRPTMASGLAPAGAAC